MLWDWDYTCEILPILAQRLDRHHRGDDPRLRARRHARAWCSRILRMSRSPGSSLPTAGFVEFIRSTPLLIQIFFIFFVFPEFGIILDAFTAGVLALGLHYGDLLLGGLPRRPRQHPARPVGGVDGAQPQRLAHVPRHHHPAGDPAGRAGARQLPRRALQGDAAALGHRGARADADGEDPRLGELPLYRADHARRRVLPGLQPRHRGAASGWSSATSTDAEGSDDAQRPSEPMVRFDKVTKSYGALTVLDEPRPRRRRAARRWRSSARRARARPPCCAC